MNNQLPLFNTDEFVNGNIKNLTHYVRSNNFWISIDKLKETSKLYGVLCDTIIKIYENEQLSDNSDD